MFITVSPFIFALRNQEGLRLLTNSTYHVVPFDLFKTTLYVAPTVSLLPTKTGYQFDPGYLLSITKKGGVL